MVALELCLQKLEPKPEDLKNLKKRLNWCNRVQSVRSVIQVMQTLIPRLPKEQNVVGISAARFQTDQLCGDQFARILRGCRYVVNHLSFIDTKTYTKTYYVYNFRTMWIRLDVVRLFIEHTCPPGHHQADDPADSQNAVHLWKVNLLFIPRLEGLKRTMAAGESKLTNRNFFLRFFSCNFECSFVNM